MKLYLVCPVCGTKLGKAESIKNFEFPCPKCHEELIADVAPDGIRVRTTSSQSITDSKTDVKLHSGVRA